MTVLLFIGAHWRMFIAGGLALALYGEDAARRHAEDSFAKYKATEQLQSAQTETHAAKAGTETVTHVIDQDKKDGPVADRVGDRLRRAECVRQPAKVVYLPGAAGVPDAPAGEAQDVRGGGSDDGAFVDAAAADLKACKSELNRFSGLQDWIRAVQKPPK